MSTPSRLPGASLKARALRLLAQREHSRVELAGKLERQVQAAAVRAAQRAVAQGSVAGGGSGGGRGGGRGARGVRGGVGVSTGADALDPHRSNATVDPPDDTLLPQQPLAAQIEAVLDELQQHGLLSDERAAASLLAVRAPRHGERRLRHDLQAKGLDPTLVAQTLALARDTELPRALALWQRRFGQPAVDAASHAKQVRFLAGRGFTMDTIMRVLRQARAEAAAGDDSAAATPASQPFDGPDTLPD